MKSNRGLMIAIIAGVAIAGVAGYLFGTEKGISLRKKIQSNKGKIFSQASEVVSGMKDRFTPAKKIEKFTEQFSDM